MKTPVLETKRLYLKPVTANDAKEIFEGWTSDPEVSKFMRYPTHQSIDDTLGWLQADEVANQGEDLYNWEFVLKANDEIIGTGGLTKFPEAKEFEIGYNIKKKYWNQGITTEAVTEFVRFAKEELGQKKLKSCYCVDNPRSGRVLEKAGFVKVGTGKDQKFDGSVTFDTILCEINLEEGIRDTRIDNGKVFDWGRTSKEYGKYRDIYPDEFYQRIVEKGLCTKGQKILDLGTGTGVLPRNMAKFGAQWIGTDISKEQIEEAQQLSKGLENQLEFQVASAEELNYPAESFDVITACQCFFYFNHEVVIPKLAKLLKPHGKLVILYMAWLPFEDEIAGKSEQLVLKYNPEWSGANETKHPIEIPICTKQYFKINEHEEYDLDIPFTRESWNGRMKACRGVGASLSETEIASWEKEHKQMLLSDALEQFTIKHYGAMTILEKL